MIIKIVTYSLIFLSFNCLGQIERGNLVLNPIPIAVDSFFYDNEINLSKVRKTTNFITNRDISSFNGYPIPRRKKAFIRHVKHLSEQLEQAYIDKRKRSNQLNEIVWELLLLESSLRQKTLANSNNKVTIKQKVSMAVATRKSKRVFRYSIPLPNKKAVLKDPNDSPYWHKVTQDSIHKQFATLAKQKKIKIRKNMVVLFDDLSFGGSAPKINTLDLDLDNKWSLKWGDEVHTDVVGSRIFAAMGYDVDHPYHYKKDRLTLIFDDFSTVSNLNQLKDSITKIYSIDLTPFVSSYGLVSKQMAEEQANLIPYIGKQYARFINCAIEARPDRVKRIGSFLPHEMNNPNRQELRASLLLHHFIGNWDTREDNTLLTTVHSGNYNYRISAVFSDLGTSLGTTQHKIPSDFKVGLINELPWKTVVRKKDKILFTNKINAILPMYQNATYNELAWMAQKLTGLDEYNLRKIITKAHWPKPIAELYFHKLASRRASILEAFEINDPHPIHFDKNLTISKNGNEIIKNGRLVIDYKKESNPEGFLSKKGRFRNYGN